MQRALPVDLLPASDMDARCRRSWEAFEAAHRDAAARADASAAALEVDLLTRLDASVAPPEISVTTSFDGRDASP